MVLSPFQKELKDQYTLDIGPTVLISVTQAPLLGILFDAHVLGLCKKASFQLLTLKRLANYLDVHIKLTILQSFIRSNFTYGCHVWYFCSPTLREKVERIQYRGLRYVYCDYDSSHTALLERSGLQSIDLLIQKTILVEIFKCLHKIGAKYLANLFSFGSNSTRSNNVDLVVPRVKSTTYGLHSLRYHGTYLWSHMPIAAKTANSLENFKMALQDFKGVSCKCNLCRFSSQPGM